MKERNFLKSGFVGNTSLLTQEAQSQNGESRGLERHSGTTDFTVLW